MATGTMAAKEATVKETKTEAQERRRGGDRRAQGAKTRIVIVDGHTLFRRGVRNILELEGDMEVVGEAGSGREALAILRVRKAQDLPLEAREGGAGGRGPDGWG